MSTQETMAALVAANDGQEVYRRIANSQGNIVFVEVGSESGSSSSSGSSGSSSSSSSGTKTSTGKTIIRSSKTTTSSSSKTTSKTSSGDQEEESVGPGYTEQEYIEDSEISGPTVEDVSISESYYEDFGVYEESLNDMQFFYATVANGGITDQGVQIDLPAGMNYEMVKDGVEIDWNSGQTVTERGSYVLKLTVAEDDSVPFSEQKLYKAVFRFRIQERLPQTEESTEEYEAEEIYEYASDLYDNYTGILSGAETGFAPGAESTEAATEAAVETEEIEAEETEAEETEAADGESAAVMDGDGSIDGDALEDAVQAALGDGYGTEGLEGYCAGTGLSSSYSEESGIYRHELASGEVFYTDIPNGTLTNSSVILTTNDALPFVVLKDGEQIEYESGKAIDEPGSYLVFPRSDTSVYLAAYDGKNEPLFHFRIVNGTVNDLGLITAPQDGTIRSVALNGEELDGAEGQEWFFLSEDGQYTVEFDTPSGGSTVTFRRDTAAPRFYYSLNGQKATISYVSDDVVSTRLTQGGEVVYDGNPVSELSDTGTYEFSAYDEAGNSSSADITISYRMNMAAILAIFLIVLLVVLLVVFIRRAKKQMKVV